MLHDVIAQLVYLPFHHPPYLGGISSDCDALPLAGVVWFNDERLVLLVTAVLQEVRIATHHMEKEGKNEVCLLPLPDS